MPKESSHCICLLVILTDSVFDMGNPQKRCRQIYQQCLKKSSDNSDENVSDEESDAQTILKAFLIKQKDYTDNHVSVLSEGLIQYDFTDQISKQCLFEEQFS